MNVNARNITIASLLFLSIFLRPEARAQSTSARQAETNPQAETTQQDSTTPQAARAPLSARVAYFHLGRVKASCREVHDAEILRLRAETQLRQAVQSSLDRLAKLESEKRAPDEVAKIEKQCRDEVRAKQEALAELIERNWRIVRQRISQAVSEVSAQKGFDVVVDLDGIFRGGDRFEKCGEDITDDVIRRMN